MNDATRSAGHPNQVKKWLSCLGCGRPLWTDRCHRICRKCRRRHDASPGRQAFPVSLPHGAVLVESPSRREVFDY